MKGISNGLFFDTEKAVLVVSLKDCEYGNGDIYRTEKGNFFIHNHDYEGSENGENLELLPLEDLDGIISEWKDLGTVVINFEEFELG
jgi:hypothetical protein